MIGEKYGRLTILKSAGRNNKKHKLWLCKCDCGNAKIINQNFLRSGGTKSCGCLKRENLSKGIGMKHGLSKHRINKIYFDMIQRCENKNNPNYKNYGGRSIKICDEWRSDYLSFHEWSMENGYRDNLSIDRIDNDGDYEPNNCRWTNNIIQSRNRSYMRRSKTGVVGVAKTKNGTFRAIITVDKKKIDLGHYNNLNDAKKVRKQAEDKYFKGENIEISFNNRLLNGYCLNKGIKCNELNIETNSVSDMAEYFVKNNMCRTKKVSSVRNEISSALTGRKSKYLGFTFSYL